MADERVGRDPQAETGTRSTGTHPGLRRLLGCDQRVSWGSEAEADVGTVPRAPLGGATHPTGAEL